MRWSLPAGGVLGRWVTMIVGLLLFRRRRRVVQSGVCWIGDERWCWHAAAVDRVEEVLMEWLAMKASSRHARSSAADGGFGRQTEVADRRGM
ncbi:hypothetical protein ACLOJK_018769 [Asimina triloba]